MTPVMYVLRRLHGLILHLLVVLIFDILSDTSVNALLAFFCMLPLSLSARNFWFDIADHDFPFLEFVSYKIIPVKMLFTSVG